MLIYSFYWYSCLDSVLFFNSEGCDNYWFFIYSGSFCWDSFLLTLSCFSTQDFLVLVCWDSFLFFNSDCWYSLCWYSFLFFVMTESCWYFFRSDSFLSPQSCKAIKSSKQGLKIGNVTSDDPWRAYILYILMLLISCIFSLISYFSVGHKDALIFAATTLLIPLVDLDHVIHIVVRLRGRPRSTVVKATQSLWGFPVKTKEQIFLINNGGE